jgi:hypothetical protein
LVRNISEPFRVWAWLNHVPGEHGHKFHYVNTEDIFEHAVKLNILADLIYFDSNRDDDLIIFLDGDAFPVADMVPFVRTKLKEYPLVAVQRLENNADIQPHPCFCVTTVDFWKRIGGDWKQGYTWVDPQGKKITDIGGNLLGILHCKQVNWYPMHRSNRTNLHPLWFGIYEGLVYHHGAGFRYPSSRIDRRKIEMEAKRTWRWPIGGVINHLTRTRPGLRYLQRLNPIRALEMRTIRQNRVLSDQVFARIRGDSEFYRELN